MRDNIIGANIRKLRKKEGFTQNNLAQFIQVDQSMISKIESGDRSLPCSTLEKLATLFGVTMEQMESEDMVVPEYSFPFKSSSLNVTEMEALTMVNRIALNTAWMEKISEENHGV